MIKLVKSNATDYIYHVYYVDVSGHKTKVGMIDTCGENACFVQSRDTYLLLKDLRQIANLMSKLEMKGAKNAKHER